MCQGLGSASQTSNEEQPILCGNTPNPGWRGTLTDMSPSLALRASAILQGQGRWERALGDVPQCHQYHLQQCPAPKGCGDSSSCSLQQQNTAPAPRRGKESQELQLSRHQHPPWANGDGEISVGMGDLGQRFGMGARHRSVPAST